MNELFLILIGCLIVAPFYLAFMISEHHKHRRRIKILKTLFFLNRNVEFFSEELVDLCVDRPELINHYVLFNPDMKGVFHWGIE